MNIHILTLAAVFATTVALADDAGDRAKLTGTWQAQTPGKDGNETWTLEEGDDSMKIVHSVGDQKVAEYKCSTLGQDCEIEKSGKRVKISMWFNGSKLVQMETAKGPQVIRRRFSVAPSGDVLELETAPIVPGGTPEVTKFKRVQLTAARP